MDFEKAFPPEALQKAESIAELQDVLMNKCTEFPHTIAKATEYIMGTNFINSDEGVCILLRNIIFSIYVRPHGLTPMVLLYLSIDSKASDDNHLGKLEEYLFDFDNAYSNSKTSMVLIYHLYLRKKFSEEYIYKVCKRSIEKRSCDHRLVILMYSYFGPLLDKKFPQLFSEYKELINKITAMHETCAKYTFFSNFISNWRSFSFYSENDWEYQLECAEYGHPIGSLKHFLKYDQVDELYYQDSNLATLVNYGHDEFYEWHDQLEGCQSYLQFAAFYGSYHCFLALLRARGICEMGRISDDGILMKMAIYGGNRDIIKLCESLIANSKKAPHYCVMAHRNNMLSYYLLSRSNEARFICDDYVKESLLHSSTISNNLEAVLYCLNNGQDINKQTNLGETPLHYAAENYAFDVLEFLFSYKKIRVLYSSKNTVSFNFRLS